VGAGEDEKGGVIEGGEDGLILPNINAWGENEYLVRGRPSRWDYERGTSLGIVLFRLRSIKILQNDRVEGEENSPGERMTS